MQTICSLYITEDAPEQINIDTSTARAVTRAVQQAKISTIPMLRRTFDHASSEVQSLLYLDVYPRFLRFKLTQSAARALTEDVQFYQGLGDCFCLTSPHLQDNPIIYLSDGFTRVTGYERNEIINRNCRFLQGKFTDRSAITRLKRDIRGQKETVELLLNYRKDGRPFWNLLYISMIQH